MFHHNYAPPHSQRHARITWVERNFSSIRAKERSDHFRLLQVSLLLLLLICSASASACSCSQLHLFVSFQPAWCHISLPSGLHVAHADVSNLHTGRWVDCLWETVGKISVISRWSCLNHLCHGSSFLPSFLPPAVITVCEEAVGEVGFGIRNAVTCTRASAYVWKASYMLARVVIWNYRGQGLSESPKSVLESLL